MKLTPNGAHDESHGPRYWGRILRKEFAGESDRASVILGAALLDSALETLLKTFLVSVSSAEDPLFDGANAPLASFSARIEIAYRVGLIDATLARCLHLVRKIRNDFAHNITGCTFTDSAVVGRMTELRRASGLPDCASDIRDNFPSGPRGDFQMIVSWYQWILRGEVESVRQLRSDGALAGSCEKYQSASDGDTTEVNE